MFGTGSMLVIGKSFVRVSEDKNQAEAEFRYTLTRVRENGESIALLGGEEEERDGIDPQLTKVSARKLAPGHGPVHAHDVRLAGLGLHRAGGADPPVRAEIPRRRHEPRTGHAGRVRLHHRADARSAGWSTTIRGFANWNAYARRIASLMMSLDAPRARRARPTASSRSARETALTHALQLRDLSVTLDDGTAVVGETEVDDRAGRDGLLVVGESGTGKSTLVRAIAGLWPWGGGRSISSGTPAVHAAAKILCARRDRCAAPPPIRAGRRQGPDEEVARSARTRSGSVTS